MMAMQKESMPTCVKVVGWFWIIAGSLMLFSCVMGIFAFKFGMQQMQSQYQLFSNETAKASMLSIVYDHFAVLSSLQFVIASFMILSGIYFLKLRRWAKTILELLSWLGILFIAGFYLILILQGGTYYSFISSGLSVVMFLIYVVPLIVIIRTLRGTTVKSVMK